MTCSFLMFSSLTVSGMFVHRDTFSNIAYSTLWQYMYVASVCITWIVFQAGICNISFISSQKHCLKSPQSFGTFLCFPFRTWLYSTRERNNGGNVARFLSSKWKFLITDNHHHVVLMTQRLPQLFTVINCKISIDINPPTLFFSSLKFIRIHSVCKMRNNRIDYKKVTMEKEKRKNKKIGKIHGTQMSLKHVE